MHTDSCLSQPVDIYFRGNGREFFQTRIDQRPRLDRIDYIEGNEPSPDDEESWRMR